jgi:nucleoside-triphosphatase THEP1
MNTIHLYENGTPFQAYSQINENIDDLIIRKNEHKPCLLLIDGMPSSGKTTIGVQLMDIINKKHDLPQVNLNSPKEAIQIGTGAEEFIQKLRQAAEEGQPIIMFDEAGEYNRRGWNTKLNKILDSIMDTFRAYNIIVIMVLHDFTELPKHIWNVKLPTMLIHLKERTGNEGSSQWYDLKDMYWIIHNRKQQVFPEDAYKLQTPVFRTHFKNLSEIRSQQLDKLSTTAKRNKLQGAEIKVQGLLYIKDIKELIQMSEVWIKKKIKELHIKEETTYKKRKYYTQDIISKLRNHIKK